MAGKRGNSIETRNCTKQIRLELENSRKTVERLAGIIQLVGETGVTDPATARELEIHLGAAYAAAHRWLLESRLQAAGTGIASGL